MTPREFEELVASLLRAEGYETRLGSYVDDWGVDIFASRGGERLAVQVKMYGGSTRSVNRECIMQLHGAAANFDCTGAVLATDGGIAADALAVAEKLAIRILRAETTPRVGITRRVATSGLAENHPATPRSVAEDCRAPTFDEIWERYVMPLAGRTLVREDGTSNKVVSVDWACLIRVTSGGNRQSIPVEIFRYAIETVLTRGSITRDEINQHYPGRASSGIVLVLAQVPLFEVGGRRVAVRMRSAAP